MSRLNFVVSVAIVCAAFATTAEAQNRKYTEAAAKAVKANPELTFNVLKAEGSGAENDAALLAKLNEWGNKIGNVTFEIENGVIFMHTYFVHQGVESQPAGWKTDYASNILFERAGRAMASWNEDFELNSKKFVGIEFTEIEPGERTETRNRAGKRSWKWVATGVGKILVK